MQKSARGYLFVIFIFGSALIASISSCSSSASTQANSTGAANTAGASKGAIKLGLISTLNSPSFSFKDTAQAFNAAVDAINASGGIAGHQVDAIVCDDHGQASGMAQCANQLINIDNVAAIGGGLSAYDGSLYSAAKAANVPVICQTGADITAAQIPTYFACGSSTVAYYNIPILYQPGWKTVSLVNYQGLPSVQDELVVGGQHANSTVQVKDIAVPVTTVDWSPVVAQAQAQGANALVSQLAASANVALLQAEVSAGVKIPLLSTSGQIQSAVAAYASAHGIPIYVAGAFINDPAVSKLRAEELADFKKYAPGIDDDLSDATASAWLYPNLIKIGAESGKLTNFSRADIVAWAESQTGLQTNFIAPLDWKSAGPVAAYPRFSDLWSIPEMVADGGQSEELLHSEFEMLVSQKAVQQIP